LHRCDIVLAAGEFKTNRSPMLREIKTSKLIKEWFLDISTVLHTYNILWLEPVLRKLWQPPGVDTNSQHVPKLCASPIPKEVPQAESVPVPLQHLLG
jgi:hypothetical protein